MPSWKKVVVSGSDAAIPSVSTTADFTIDAGGDIVLDADGTDILLKDDGTAFGRFKRDSSDFIIKSETNNKDIVFRGQDGGATITAMTLDMSEGGNVGIGTTSPNNKLDIRRGSDGIALELHSTVGDADEFVDFKMISGNGTAGTLGTIFRHQRQGTGGGDMIILTNPTLSGTPAETIRFTSDQKVGIGTTNPSVKLEVDGEISGSTIRASGDVIAFNSSDERLKDNIVQIENPLEKMESIGGYEFDWNNNQQIYHGHDIGVIAQEIEKVLPEAVKDRGSGYKGVQYDKLIPLLIESIKELKQKVEDIEKNCDCLNK